MERVIEEKIDQFYGWVEKHPGRRGQVGHLSITSPASYVGALQVTGSHELPQLQCTQFAYFSHKKSGAYGARLNMCTA